MRLGDDLEAVVREHAQRVVTADARAREDLAADVRLEPPDLLDHLLAARFRGFELVARARIGTHYVFKTKYLGPTTIVVQARWARREGGAWQLLDAEVARVAVEESGPEPS